MSRSFRKTPITGYSNAKSDKPDKIIAHRKQRAANRDALAKNRNLEDLIVPLPRETSNRWDFAKDGKVRLNSADRHYRKSMRK